MVLKHKKADETQPEEQYYITVGVHVGHFKQKSVATIINKKLLKNFILPALDDYNRDQFNMLLMIPSFQEFKIKDKPDGPKDETINILDLMYKKYGCLNIPKLQKDGVLKVSMDDKKWVYPPLKAFQVDKKTLLVGQIDEGKKWLHGVGRKMWISGAFGYINDGQFVDGQLKGFGRHIRNTGFCATGWWKDDNTLHGYAKRINKDQTIQEGLWEDAYWFSGKTKAKEDIKLYDPDNDMIGKKIEDFKYDLHVVNTDKMFVKRHNDKIYHAQLKKITDQENEDKTNKKQADIKAVIEEFDKS